MSAQFLPIDPIRENILKLSRRQFERLLEELLDGGTLTEGEAFYAREELRRAWTLARRRASCMSPAVPTKLAVETTGRIVPLNKAQARYFESLEAASDGKFTAWRGENGQLYGEVAS